MFGTSRPTAESVRRSDSPVELRLSVHYLLSPCKRSTLGFCMEFSRDVDRPIHFYFCSRRFGFETDR